VGEDREGGHEEVSTIRTAAAAVLLVCLVLPVATAAQTTAEDELGNWLIWNGTFFFSPKWSMFTEAQLRLWEVASNPNDIFGRVAAHYNFTPKYYVGAGYMHSSVWSFDTAFDDGPDSRENRIYEQLTMAQGWSRTAIEHRYRLEQRWIRENNDTRYTGRFRYRFQVTTPINKPALEKGAWFTNFYNELFVNLGSNPTFDQNRLYGAGGYKFTDLANLQVGLLWQARSNADFLRLQFFYTHNFKLYG
jgi:hypothetical protein